MCNLELNEMEQRVLTERLETDLKQMELELSRTEFSRDFREALKSRVQVIERILNLLTQAQPVLS